MKQKALVGAMVDICTQKGRGVPGGVSSASEGGGDSTLPLPHVVGEGAREDAANELAARLPLARERRLLDLRRTRSCSARAVKRRTADQRRTLAWSCASPSVDAISLSSSFARASRSTMSAGGRLILSAVNVLTGPAATPTDAAAAPPDSSDGSHLLLSPESAVPTPVPTPVPSSTGSGSRSGSGAAPGSETAG